MNGLIKGIAIGLGVSAVGLYLYKKNEGKVDSFLSSHGVPVCDHDDQDLNDLSLEDLMNLKEDIEDIIAEREMLAEDDVVVCCEECDCECEIEIETEEEAK